MDAQLTWRRTLDRLTTAEPLKPLQPLAQLSEGTLILGIGSAGARVLELLAERVEDTNFQLAAPGQSHLSFLCLRFDDSAERSAGPLVTAKPQSDASNNVPITTVTITETHIATDAQKHPEAERLAEWLWLAANPSGGGFGLDRRAARVMLFNHLQVGQAAPLVQGLRVKLKGIRRVYLVASALEYAGSSLIADLTALLRLQAPLEGISIMALVLFEDKHPENRDLDNATFNQDRFRAITLHELSRLSQDGRVNYRYGNSERLIYAGEAQHLLDGAAIVNGQNGLGCQRLSSTLWGLITAQEFSGKLNTAIGGIERAGLLPSVSIVYSHALYWPLRLLRKRYTALLVKYAIGDGQPPITWRPPQRFTDPAQIGLWLDAHHDGGLLDIIEFLSRYDARYNSLRQPLQILRAEADKALTETNNVLNRLNMPPEHERFVPPSVKGWSQLVLSVPQLDKVRAYAGWEVARDPNSLLQLVVGLSNEGQATQISLQPPKWRDIIWDMAARLADRFVQSIAERPLVQQIDDSNVQVKRSWHGRYAAWIKETGELGGQDIENKSFELSRTPFNSWTPMDGIAPDSEAVVGSDSTFILQTTVIARMPVAHWRLINNPNIQLSLNDLVDAPEVFAYRLIVERYHMPLEKISLFWRNLLPHSEALIAFLACATGHGFSNITSLVNITFPLINTPDVFDEAVAFWQNTFEHWFRTDAPQDWRYALDSFVTSYETDPDRMLHERLQPYLTRFLTATDSPHLLLLGQEDENVINRQSPRLKRS